MHNKNDLIKRLHVCVFDCKDTGCLFAFNEKLLTQHILGPATKHTLLEVSNKCRARARAGASTRGVRLGLEMSFADAAKFHLQHQDPTPLFENCSVSIFRDL